MGERIIGKAGHGERTTIATSIAGTHHLVMAMGETHKLDIVIFGGGAAGLWLLGDLRRRGFSAGLLEAGLLGQGQTLASQGIIHGGLKYTLQGAFSDSAKAIRDMPTRWSRCLAGEDQPNLSKCKLRAEHCYLWRTGSIRSWMTLTLAKQKLTISPVALDREHWPDVLAKCPQVLRLDEQVIDPESFVENLAASHWPWLLKINSESGVEFEFDRKTSHVSAICLADPTGEGSIRLCPQGIVLAAGSGNDALRQQIGLTTNVMQRRPLHMIMVRGQLPVLNGHCVEGAKTRVSITTGHDKKTNNTVWQVGGQVAEDGVTMDRCELIAYARSELEASIPAMNLAGARWSTYRVDRAEALSGGHRPDDAQIIQEGNIITVWPTKLSLVPRLAEMVQSKLAGLIPTVSQFETAMSNWARPRIAPLPWEGETEWICDD